MRDIGTFIVGPGASGLPAGNFAGYIDREPRFFVDPSLPFPHVRATYGVTQCVMRIERLDHPEAFAADEPYNSKDVDVTGFVANGIISYDQYVVPDALARGAR